VYSDIRALYSSELNKAFCNCSLEIDETDVSEISEDLSELMRFLRVCVFKLRIDDFMVSS
jgi:EAL domain-containing protein (putative c-di-GMP-specific phosphodiesterase class I)